MANCLGSLLDSRLMGLVAAHYCGAPWRRVAARRRCRCVDANLEREIDEPDDVEGMLRLVIVPYV